MRKKALIGIAVAAALGFSSCQKENVTVEEPSARLITETFSASFEQETTKTTIAEDETTGKKAVSWAKDDTVHYYTSDGGKVRKDTIKADGPSATLTLEREEGDTCYNLVYTGSTAPTFATRTSNSMVFDGVRTAQDGTFSNANVSVAHTAPGSGSITFKPVTALVKFTTSRTDIKTIILSGGLGIESVAGSVSVDPTAEKPIATLSGTGSTSITVTIGTPKAGTYYINVLPVTYSKGLKLTLKNSSGGIIGTATASMSIDLSAGGKMINLGNIDSHIVVTDLSSAGTANSYIVSSAGTYKFKAVKGNSSTSVGTVKSVAVLWESYGTDTPPVTGDLIKTEVSYADGYITFITNDTYKEGNAVIAAYSGAGGTGDILWSWHIWLTDMPASQVYNKSAGTMMDRNLGATSADRGQPSALGLLYQWGRKDPFLGSSAISSNTKAKSTGTWPSATASTTTTGQIDYVVKHPMQFITSEGDWKNTKDNTLWQRPKTVYDPCPPGWRVPRGGDDGLWSTAFGSKSTFTDGPWDGTNYGMDFGSGNGQGKSKQLGTASVIWYPAAGYLYGGGGTLTYVGSRGRVWACTVSDDNASAFNYDSENSKVVPSTSYQRAYGRSVRCLKIL